MSNIPYLEKREAATKLANNLIGELLYLSEAFYDTGNDRMSGELQMLSELAVKSRNLFLASSDEMFGIYTDSVQQGTRNMMEGILGMAKLSMENDITPKRGKSEDQG